MMLTAFRIRAAYLRLLGVLAAVAFLGELLFAETPPSKQAAPRHITVCYIEAGHSSKLQLHIACSAGTIWEHAFAQLHDFFDRNDDGVLDEREAARLPSAFALRQVLWGRFAMQAGVAPLWKELALDPDREVGLVELTNYYRNRGVGDVTVAAARVTAANVLHDALIRRLDADGDGRLVERELSNVYNSLASLDDNDDGLIGPGELASEVDRYPGVTGTILVDRLPASGPSLAREGLFVGERTTIDDVAAGGEVAVDMASDEDADHWRIRSTLQTVWNVRTDKGRLGEQAEFALKNVESWLRRLDRDRNGVVTAAEVSAAEAVQFREWLNKADRNDDGNLTLVEGCDWLDVQRTVAQAHTLFTVLDFGRGLFEFIDANHDGGLAAAECRDVLPRLRAACCLTEEALNVARLPRCLLAIVANGHPRAPLVSGANAGPAWFRAMDRNADGTVTHNEFLGARETFRRLDRNANEAITAGETTGER